MRSAVLFAITVAGLAPALLAQRSVSIESVQVNGRSLFYRSEGEWAVAEGDWILGRAEDLKKSGGRSAAYFPVRHRWPDAIIPYVINPDVVEPGRVHEAIGIWNESGVVRFVERTNEAAAYVRIRHQVGGLCSAFGGTVGGEQFVNLPPFCDVRDTVHELGHIIGLGHEHQQPGRDKYLAVNHSELLAANRPLFETQMLIRGGPYDYESIMHYGKLQAGRSGKTVLQTSPAGIPTDFSIRNPLRTEAVLSLPLLEAIRRDYGRVADVVVTTNPEGLPIVVDGVECQSPQRLDWSEGTLHDVEVPELHGDGEISRYRFARWSDGGERRHRLEAVRGGMVLIADFTRENRLRTGVTPADAGRVDVRPAAPDGYYPEGSLVQIRATPNEGFVFESWVGRNDLTQARVGAAANPATVALYDSDAEYLARFQTSSLTTVTTEPAGLVVRVDNVVRLTPYRSDWAPGSVHTLNAGLQTGPFGVTRYVFEGWSDGASATRSVAHGPENATYTARYRVQHLLTLNEPEGVTITATPASADGFYDEGTTVRLEARTASGLPFVTWTWDLSGGENAGRIVMDRDKFVGARFGTPPEKPVFAGPEQVWITAVELITEQFYPLSTGEIGIRFQVEADQSWVMVTADKQVTPAMLKIVVNSEGLAPGTHEAFVQISSDAASTDRSVPIRVLVPTR